MKIAKVVEEMDGACKKKVKSLNKYSSSVLPAALPTIAGGTHED